MGSPSGFAPAAIDSTSFLKTKSLGVAPQNTDLTITYRAGGGVVTNVGANTLTRIINKDMIFATPNLSSLSAVVVRNITNSLACNNGDQASGGEQPETVASIRENAVYNMGSQLRCVTLQDYQARIMAMPSNFGSVFRSFVRKDPNNSMGVEMFLVTRNSQLQLTYPSAVIMNNIETYIKNFKSFSDTIKLTSGRLINIGVDFTVVPHPSSNAQETLMECIMVLQRLFETSRTNFNDSVVIPDIQARLQSLRKVRSVPNLKIVNKTTNVGTRNLFEHRV